MSAILNATPWNVPIGRSNCRRSFAYADAASYAACARPSAMAPMPMRPPSSVFRNSLSPSPSPPSRLPAGMRQSSKMSCRCCWHGGPSSPPCADAEAGRIGLDDEGADLAGAFLAIGDRRDDVRARHPGVGDEALAAIEHPAVAVAARSRPRAARVAPRPWLGEAVGADHLAGCHRSEVSLLLLIGAGQPDRVAAEAGVRADDDADAARDPRQLLDGDRVGK